MLRRRRRRVGRTRIAHGDYRVRISPPGLGSEFDQLGTSIN